ncbi:interleukin-15 isoform X2 [Oryzias latipes]|uniref:interleukin-15 isoform X2 n=1 Tax=Oryzias latipes TaxID=8090 RepID=UPI0005CB92AD|nr:interleukin-15 isoform X2 [Oryzias latipes]
MLRGGPAVLGVFLCFMFPPMLTSPSNQCPRTIITLVEQLRKLNCLQDCPDSTLYTPDVQDFKRCPSTTLRCFVAELQVLRAELTHDGCIAVSNRTARRLEVWSNRYKTEQDCLQCELLEETSVDNFLQSLVSVLQNICSESAS